MAQTLHDLGGVLDGKDPLKAELDYLTESRASNERWNSITLESEDAGLVPEEEGNARPSLDGPGAGNNVFQDFLDPSSWDPVYIFKEVFLGITIAMAQIPESVAFAYLARVKPPVALHAAWIVGLTCSLFGGRPAMVNGATGAFAAIIGTFIVEQSPERPDAFGNTRWAPGLNGLGVETLFPSVMLAGYLMLIVSWTRLARFISLLPGSVMIGFCNGLAIVIGLAQLHPLQDPETHTWKTGTELYGIILIAVTAMVIMEFLPKAHEVIKKYIPAPLVAIVVSIVINTLLPENWRAETIGDVSEFTDATRFPIPFWTERADAGVQQYQLENIFTMAGVQQICTQGFFLALVGCIESLMTSEVVESFVKTPSNGDRTVLAMGAGNIISGLFGGMGGNAMIGLSTINCLSGGTGRLAPSICALIIMVCMFGLSGVLNFIPVAALSGIMIVVVIHTFKWFSIGMVLAAFLPKSIRKLGGDYLKQKVPRLEVFVIIVVTILCAPVVPGSNIAFAVLVGVTICTFGYAWRSAKTFDWNMSYDPADGTKTYDITGPLFFASSNVFTKILNANEDPSQVIVRFSDATNIMDFSSLKAMHDVSIAYQALGKSIRFESLQPKSIKLIDKANALVAKFEYTAKEIRVPEVKGVAPLPEKRDSVLPASLEPETAVEMT